MCNPFLNEFPAYSILGSRSNTQKRATYIHTIANPSLNFSVLPFSLAHSLPSLSALWLLHKHIHLHPSNPQTTEVDTQKAMTGNTHLHLHTSLPVPCAPVSACHRLFLLLKYIFHWLTAGLMTNLQHSKAPCMRNVKSWPILRYESLGCAALLVLWFRGQQVNWVQPTRRPLVNLCRHGNRDGSGRADVWLSPNRFSLLNSHCLLTWYRRENCPEMSMGKWFTGGQWVITRCSFIRQCPVILTVGCFYVASV